MKMTANYTCAECYTENTEVSVVENMVVCPKCGTRNDIWLEGNPEPKRHTDKLKAYKSDTEERNTLSLFGYFNEPTHQNPHYDPGLDVPCVICFKPLDYPAEPICTISFSAFFDYADRSYFYRTHKHCYDRAETDDIGAIEASVMGKDFGAIQDLTRSTSKHY